MVAGPQFSSLGRSIAAYQPYYAPPVAPQSQFIQGSSPFATQNPVPNSTAVSPAGRSAVVRRRFRMNGMRIMYSQGGQAKSWFPMRATGQVESTKFQPILAGMWNGFFNDALFAVGHPQNLGLSEKVPTIPPAALGTAPWQMNSAPRFKRNIFTNRNFGTQPGLPAQPTNGMHS